MLACVLAHLLACRPVWLTLSARLTFDPAGVSVKWLSVCLSVCLLALPLTTWLVGYRQAAC